MKGIQLDFLQQTEHAGEGEGDQHVGRDRAEHLVRGDGMPVEHVVEQPGGDRAHERRCCHERRRPQPVLAEPVGGDAVQGEQREDANDHERATARVQRPQGDKQDSERPQSQEYRADRGVGDQWMDQDEQEQPGEQHAAAIAAQIGTAAQQASSQPRAQVRSAGTSLRL